MTGTPFLTVNCTCPVGATAAPGHPQCTTRKGLGKEAVQIAQLSRLLLSVVTTDLIAMLVWSVQEIGECCRTSRTSLPAQQDPARPSDDLYHAVRTAHGTVQLHKGPT